MTTAQVEDPDLKSDAARCGASGGYPTVAALSRSRHAWGTTCPSRGTCLADRKIYLCEGGNLALRRLRLFSLITTMDVVPSAHRSTTGTSS